MEAILPDIHPDGRIEFERPSSGRRLGIAEHDADLLAHLVDEHQAGIRFGDDGRQFAQRLRHEARLQPRQRIPHLPFEFRLGNQRGDGIDDKDVDRAAAHQHLRDFERLFPAIGLRHEQFVRVDTKHLGILGIHRVLRIDECRRPACLLCLRDGMERDGRLAARLRPEDLDDAPSRKPAYAQGRIKRERAGGYRLDPRGFAAVSEPHDRPFAELLFDLGQRHLDCLILVARSSAISISLPECDNRKIHVLIFSPAGRHLPFESEAGKDGTWDPRIPPAEHAVCSGRRQAR